MTTLECSDPERVRDQYSVMGRGASGPPGHVVPSHLVTSGADGANGAERASEQGERACAMQFSVTIGTLHLCSHKLGTCQMRAEVTK